MVRPGAIGVDVWNVPLGRAGWEAEIDLALLSADERERHARFLVPEPAWIFATTRLALRRVLARHLGCRPEDVPLETAAHGKPRLSDAGDLHFNVSHCPSRGLIAVCRLPVGIDIEHAGDFGNSPALEETICAVGERQWMKAHRALADAALLRLWCRKEAVLKALGSGMTGSLNRLDLGNPAATRGDAVAETGTPVSWRDLDRAGNEFAAVAIVDERRRPIDVRLHEFAHAFD